MTVLFMDSFDHYALGDVTLKGYTQASLPAFGQGAFARWGTGYSLYLMASSNDHLQKNIGVNKTTLYVGFAIKKYGAATPQVSTSYPLIRFKDDAAVDQVKLLVNGTYGIAAYDGNSSLLGTSADNVFKDQQWQYMEIKVTISDTVGEVTVRINETQVLNLTSQDTKVGTDYLRYIRFHPIYSSVYVYIDDLYIDDAGFLGNCRVHSFMPDSDGNSSDFTRSTGSNDYECVDEKPLNEDTDYISSDTLNHKSIFGITTGSLGTVHAVQVNNCVRIDQAGTRKITPIVRSNSTDYSGTEGDEIPSDYIFEWDIWELDPDDSAAWTQTKLEAAEFGLEITT